MEAVAARRSDRTAVAPPDPGGRMVGRAPGPAYERAGRRGSRGSARGRTLRHARRGPAFQRQDDVRGRLQGDALAPAPPAPGARGVRPNVTGLQLSAPPKSSSRRRPGSMIATVPVVDKWVPACAGNGMVMVARAEPCRR